MDDRAIRQAAAAGAFLHQAVQQVVGVIRGSSIQLRDAGAIARRVELVVVAGEEAEIRLLVLHLDEPIQGVVAVNRAGAIGQHLIAAIAHGVVGIAGAATLGIQHALEPVQRVVAIARDAGGGVQAKQVAHCLIGALPAPLRTKIRRSTPAPSHGRNFWVGQGTDPQLLPQNVSAKKPIPSGVGHNERSAPHLLAA